MGEEELALVRRAYRAFARRDLEALRRLSHPQIEVFAVTGIVSGSAHPYRGVDGLGDYIRDVEKVWDEIAVTPQRFEERPDGSVLVHGRVRVVRDRARVDAPNAWLWEFEDGLIRRVRVLGEI